VFARGSAPDPAGAARDAPPDSLVGWGFPYPTTLMASRLGASIFRAFGASAKVPLSVESKKSLNYSMQHYSHPFGPCVQTDTNVTGLPSINVSKGPSRSVTPLCKAGGRPTADDFTCVTFSRIHASKIALFSHRRTQL